MFLIHAVSFNQVPAKVVCEVPRGDANGTEDSAPASLRTILQEAEASGLLDLKIFGHSVRRPAGAALSTAEEDYFVIEAEGDADSRWCLRPKAFPEASAVNVNNAADFFLRHSWWKANGSLCCGVLPWIPTLGCWFPRSRSTSLPMKLRH